jgi:hypothetical protein
MKVTDDDGSPMFECIGCGSFGTPKGRLYTECCNGAGGCSCRGEFVDLGKCQLCKGTGFMREDVDKNANIRIIRSLAEAGGGYLGSGSLWT